MTLVIDNYDSFVYNIVQYLGRYEKDIIVKRNDEIDLITVKQLNPDSIIISPGPGRPEDSKISLDIIKSFYKEIPILGVCLGHQAIGYIFGSKIINAPKIVHGKSSYIYHNNDKIFNDINSPLQGARYHSLIIDRKTLSDELEVIAETDNQIIMGIKHKSFPLYGIQFHPESIITEKGLKIIENFYNLGRKAMLKPLTQKLVSGKDLTFEEAQTAMDDLMSNKAEDINKSAFLTAMTLKDITKDELKGFILKMREKAEKVEAPDNTIDTCGTGGDGLDTFNISTISAFIVAAANIPVAKHGNRSASSKCGSADVLEYLGVNVSLSAEQVSQCIKQVGIGFMFAPVMHTAMKYVAPIRKALGFRTFFNIIGPLTNPAGAKYQLIGIYDEKIMPLIGEVLKELGTKRTMLVHGNDGMDEITLTTTTKIIEVEQDKMSYYELDPQKLGLSYCSLKDIAGGDVSYNAQIFNDILNGEESPHLDIVLLNAAAALIVANKTDNFTDGIKLAKQIIKEGKALKKFEEFKQCTQTV